MKLVRGILRQAPRPVLAGTLNVKVEPAHDKQSRETKPIYLTGSGRDAELNQAGFKMRLLALLLAPEAVMDILAGVCQ